MAAIGFDSHSMPRWFTTPLAASAASFHPSNAQRATGWVSGPTSLNLMVPPPLPRGLTRVTYRLCVPGGEAVNARAVSCPPQRQADRPGPEQFGGEHKVHWGW